MTDARPLSTAEVTQADLEGPNEPLLRACQAGIHVVDGPVDSHQADHPDQGRPDMVIAPQAPSSSRTKVPLILTIIFVVLGLVGFGTWFIHKELASKRDVVSQRNPPPPPPPLVPPASQVQPVDFKIAGVHKGEGEEHAFIRELIADPSRADHTKWEYKGDRHDTRAVKEWAGHTAAVIAIGIGHKNWKFGEEARVIKPDSIAFDIKNDGKGNLTVVQYAITPPAPSKTVASDGVTKNGVHLPMVETYSVAPTAAASRFIGGENDSTVFPAPYNQYFYMDTGD